MKSLLGGCLVAAAAAAAVMVLMVLSGGPVQAAPKNKNCTPARRAEVAACTLPGQIFANYDLETPRNGSELAVICRDMREAADCGLQYTKDCLSGISASIFGLIMKNIKTVGRMRCSRTERRTFYAHLQCFEAEGADRIHHCLTAQSLRLQWIADNAELDPDLIIPALCCSSYPTFECLRDEASRVCEGVTASAAETGEFFSEMARESTGEAMELFCTRYSNEETCRAQLPEILETFDGIQAAVFNGTAPAPRSYAFSLPLTEALERPDF